MNRNCTKFSALKALLIISLCTLVTQLQTGLPVGTLIKTPAGYTAIEELNIGDLVTTIDLATRQLTSNKVTNIQSTIATGFELKIVNDTTGQTVQFLATSNQKFYTSTNGWQSAQQLKSSAYLSNIYQLTEIQSIKPHHEKKIYYELTVDESHNFFITHEDLLVHNEVIAIFGIAIAAEKIAEAVIATSVLIYTGLALGKELVCLKQSHNQRSGDKKTLEPTGGQSPDNNNPKQDQDPDKPKPKHPHGKYEDAPYHKKQQSGRKSPAPKDGQKALDNSVKISNNSPNRIGISCGQFVRLNLTRAGLYHGFVQLWNEIPPETKRELLKTNWVNHNGKILCEHLK